MGKSMKKMTAIVAAMAGLFVAAVPPAAAQSGHGHMNHATAKPGAASLAEGVVKALDKPGGKITIAHGPLENLGMPPMTMTFMVRKTAGLEGFKVGDKIRFRAEETPDGFVVTVVEAAK